MKKVIQKTVNLDLVDTNGNVFVIMDVFKRQAYKEGWNQDEIDAVLSEAKSGDYKHLLTTLKNYCEPKDESDDY